MTTSYKLVYFNMKGRGEVIRTLFRLAEQTFVDERVEFVDWDTLKDIQPFKSLPVLHITDELTNDTITVAQSSAIIRHLAAQFGLAGKNEIEKLKCDMLAEQIRDIHDGIIQVYRIDFTLPVNDYSKPLSDEKKAKLDKLFSESVPNGYKIIENILEKNTEAGGNGYLVGDSLTYVDIILAYHFDYLHDRKDEVLSQFPLLKQHDEQIRALSKISEHLEANKDVRLTILLPQ